MPPTGLTGFVPGWQFEFMKFILERVVLEWMAEQLKFERGMPPARQWKIKLSACESRMFVESNRVAAEIEALVLEDGACNVPRMKFLKVRRTFHPKRNITLAADAGGLRSDGFVMETTCFSPVAAAPGEFQMFPVTDALLRPPETAKPPPLESRWLKSRWWA